jgi:hypothetical protein
LILLLFIRIANDVVTYRIAFILLKALRNWFHPMVLANSRPHRIYHRLSSVVVNEAYTPKTGAKSLNNNPCLIPHEHKECFLHQKLKM